MTLTTLSALAYLLAGCLILLIAITGSKRRSKQQTDHYRSKTLPSEAGGSNGQCFMGDRFTATIGRASSICVSLISSRKPFTPKGWCG